MSFVPLLAVALAAALACLAGAAAAQAGPPPRTSPGPGPAPLPILPALPRFEDTSFCAHTDVPHGRVVQATYQNFAGHEKRMHVYLPPDYDAHAAARYPVLYLNHGGGDDDTLWTALPPNKGGRAQFVLDNLIAAGKAKPMIVVMPNTGGLATANPPTPGTLDDCSREYLQDIIPYVDGHYRTRPTRENRALAGLSMGGFVVMNTGLAHLDTFGELYVYSSGYFPEQLAAFEENFKPVLSDPRTNQVLLRVPLYMAAGETDIALVNAQRTMAIFNKYAVRNFWVLSTGGHQWENWSRYLYQTAQVMFPAAPAEDKQAVSPQAVSPETVSPEVHADRSVTFRLAAPQADTVQLTSSDIPGSLLGPATAMTRNADGVWEATVGPVAPGTYRYAFRLAGVSVVDPRNPLTSASVGSTSSLVDVPGSDAFDTRDVPHGAVASVTYFSSALGRSRRMHVYTPPGYEGGSAKYPVFYLLHGSGDSEDAWATVGRAGFILDNLIADKKAVPMIVVMPAGHTRPPVAGGPCPADGARDEFADDFLTDLMPYVEKNYRTLHDRPHRAIAGLSMGGGQTLNIAIPHLDRFAYVGVFSSGLFELGGRNRPGTAPAPPPGPPPAGPSAWEQRNLTSLQDAGLKKGLRLLWFSTGRDDFLLQTSRSTVGMLSKYGFHPVYEETEGAHTWLNWRDYLATFAPQLFR